MSGRLPPAPTKLFRPPPPSQPTRCRHLRSFHRSITRRLRDRIRTSGVFRPTTKEEQGFLDGDLCIKRFTAQASRVVNSVAGDVDRSAMVRQRFGQHVAPQSRARFAEFLREVLQANSKRTCEIELRRNAEPVYAVVEGVPAEAGQGSRSLRAVPTIHQRLYQLPHPAPVPRAERRRAIRLGHVRQMRQLFLERC